MRKAAVALLQSLALTLLGLSVSGGHWSGSTRSFHASHASRQSRNPHTRGSHYGSYAGGHESRHKGGHRNNNNVIALEFIPSMARDTFDAIRPPWENSMGAVGVVGQQYSDTAVANMRRISHKRDGALVTVTMRSTVGVLLDEIPKNIRNATARRFLHQRPKTWIDRARSQLRLTTYRLVFRGGFYPAPRKQLPLPPESVWRIKLLSRPFRKTISGHDLVVVKYEFTSMLVTDRASPGRSEPNLNQIGGTWREQFVLPLDPEMLFQRTRFACMNESEFPPHSVDSAEVSSFYDHTCMIETALSNRGCHQSEMPETSCKEALDQKVGSIAASLIFKRLAWNSSIAATFQTGDVTNPRGADLQVYRQEFRTSRLIYRYITADSCTIAEACVGGTGWRRLLQFSTADENTGTQDLEIGHVDYFVEGKITPLQDHHVFEYSACHNHYHFTHYGQFSFGDIAISKRGFCLQSTNRVANRITSPLNHDYGDCRHQGIAPGWVDEYKAGIECQWIDVTDVDTAHQSVSKPLTFVSNPDGFLCEGEPVADADGNPVWEATLFKTAKGEPVDRPKCKFVAGWSKNNTDSYPVRVPVSGEGYITMPCLRGEIGPLRNCGFKYSGLRSCDVGQPTIQRCYADQRMSTGIVRICDASSVLGSGTACTYEESLANQLVSTEGTSVDFQCPRARGKDEPGGLFSVYFAPLLPDTRVADLTCVPGQKNDGKP